MARPFRYTLILGTVALGAALAAAGGWRYARASAPLSGPLIVISIDTLRADHLSIYGSTSLKTPAIDQLAADGVVFERAYSHSPQTLPAHASMLSGRLPFETGVRDDTMVVKTPGRLLPGMLRERGYATAGIVSAHALRQETGIAQGFDFFDDGMPSYSADTAPDERRRDGRESEESAERWLDKIGTSRAFLFLHLNEPHKPYTAPERFSQYSPYDAEIAYSDEIVGRLVRYLKSHQLYDRSTIVLLSDHGEGLGDHGEQEHGLFVYEEAIHVPLIIKQQSNAGAGRRISDVAQHIDLVPTLLDLVKAPIPGALRGRSLKPLLEGANRLPDRAVYSEAHYGKYHFGWSELTSMTDGRHQYIRAPQEEVYDLQSDPAQRNNVAGEANEARRALREALDVLVKDGSSGLSGAEPSPPLPDPKDKREVLEAYREAIDLAGERKWPAAIAILQGIVRDDPGLAEVWNQLALFTARIDRFDLAADAYEHVTNLRPSEPAGFLGAAGALLRLRKLDQAREHAEHAAQISAGRDTRSEARAHELLARIALARNDADGATGEADLAQQAEPSWPIRAYVAGRLAYEAAQYADALPLFESAIAAVKKGAGDPVPELHFYAADTMARLERPAEAEEQFNEELRHFPQNARARAGLATLYQRTGRSDEAGEVVAEMVRVAPTPDGYALAARLWTSLGKPRQAAAVRAEARRTFTGRNR